jgi:hypothetical protein
MRLEIDVAALAVVRQGGGIKMSRLQLHAKSATRSLKLDGQQNWQSIVLIDAVEKLGLKECLVESIMHACIVEGLPGDNHR